MESVATPTVTLPELHLDPLPYHVEVRDHLKTRERELWDWFASARAQADHTETLRLELLKSAYRLEAETHPELHRAVAEAKTRLHLDIPVTLYQAQNAPEINATLFFIPGEGHVVFSGPVLSLLDADELRALLGHELAHYHLWQWEGGDLHVADRLLQAVAVDPRAAESHEQTARRFRLYTEIHADRGSLCVTGDVHTVVAALVKIETGLSQVSAPAYLRQAGEILAKGAVETEGMSHPETFIRARALALWREHGDQAQSRITPMIEGMESLSDLDLVGQARLEESTRRLLEQLLRPPWFQTPAVLGHARMFFPDLAPARAGDASVPADLRFNEAGLQEYVCYLLLDFVTADPDLEDLPLAAALDMSVRLGLEERFEKIAARELKLKAGNVRAFRERAAQRLANAEADGE